MHRNMDSHRRNLRTPLPTSRNRPQESEDSPPCLQSSPSPQTQLPHIQNIHTNWQACKTSTAKCDMCHRRKFGVVQRCVDCKLSICRNCLESGRLQHDARHLLELHSAIWDVPKSPTARKISTRHVHGSLKIRTERIRQEHRHVRRAIGHVGGDETPTSQRMATYRPSNMNTKPTIGLQRLQDDPNIQQAEVVRGDDLHDRFPPRLPGIATMIAAISPIHQPSYRNSAITGVPNNTSPFQLQKTIENIDKFHEHESHHSIIYDSNDANRQATPHQAVDFVSPRVQSLEPSLNREGRAQNTSSFLEQQQRRPPSEIARSLSLDLEDATIGAKRTNPTWPLDWCLWLQVSQAWTSFPFSELVASDPSNALHVLMTSTYLASISLGLPLLD